MAQTRTMQLVLCVVALACCALMAQAGTADVDARRGRTLLYSCSDAKALSGNCDALCKCVESKGQTVSGCTSLCEQCVSATANCPADNSLPKACADYAGNSAVNECISGGSSGRRMF